jgi:hypothetical protein
MRRSGFRGDVSGGLRLTFWREIRLGDRVAHFIRVVPIAGATSPTR